MVERNIPAMPLVHPWRTLRSLPEITLLWHDGGAKGYYDFTRQTISIRRGMTSAERRSTLQHELHHHYNGRFLRALLAKEEAACELAAARDLIDIRKLGEAMAWASDIETVADELWVDIDLVRVRCERLHPAERAYLRQRLAHLDSEPG